LRGHFALKSTRHSRWYVNKDELYTDPSAVCEVGREMAEIIYKRCRELWIHEEEIIVAAPAIGGVALTQWTGYHLQQRGMNIKAVFAEKKEKSVFKAMRELIVAWQNRSSDQTTWDVIVKLIRGDELLVREEGFCFKRGYNLKIKDRWVAVLEDILTTGTSAKETVAAVTEIGGRVFICVGLADRSEGKVSAEVLKVQEYQALVTLSLADETFDEATCPDCAAGVPINTDVGHGKAFQARKFPFVGTAGL
ncbi:hypothetical protein KW782_03195, partial [Candidatus Parcubacteria bacterium]|nr:hypothetical protein [Candidatus Parcubacteria bacterium]